MYILLAGTGVLSEQAVGLIQAIMPLSVAAYTPVSFQHYQSMAARRLVAPRRRNGTDLDCSTWSAEEMYLRTGQYFPTAPLLQGKLPSYAQDWFGFEGDCTKYQSNNRKLIPGIFVAFCLDCAMCVGFSVMSESESPKTPFEVFMTRWKKAPDTVVYDNACNLERYFLSREPGYARDIQFVIDIFHYIKGHLNCSPAYNPRWYPQLESNNTMVTEQSNARTRGIAVSCFRMGQHTFLHYARYFFHAVNLMKVFVHDTKVGK